jgi:hypothetical protein
MQLKVACKATQRLIGENIWLDWPKGEQLALVHKEIIFISKLLTIQFCYSFKRWQQLIP